MPPPSLSSRPLRLRVYPAAVLRQQCEPLTQFGKPAASLCDAMLAIMRRNHGIGLAAPQVGLSLRLLVADIGDDPRCLINPELSLLPGNETTSEGCLSLPGLSVDVARARIVEVEAQDPEGKPLRFTARGLLARVIQHEVDHLNGVLIIDHRRAGEPPHKMTPGSLSL